MPVLITIIMLVLGKWGSVVSGMFPVIIVVEVLISLPISGWVAVVQMIWVTGMCILWVAGMCMTPM